jgi:glutamyl/glutaminyl-tRNA synthetase
VDVIKNRSYQNCATFMETILACKRSESEVPFDAALARQVAEALQEAIRKKLPNEIIKRLANLSYPQFKSVNEQYMNMNKRTDILKALKVFSGNFYTALQTRCSEKYQYLCSRIVQDKDAITRILGCLTRTECKMLADCFDYYKAKFAGGRTLEDVIRAEAKKESYCTACLNLISKDTSKFPLGTDKELKEDDILIEGVVKEAEQAVKMKYDPDATIEIGEKQAEIKGVEIDMGKPVTSGHKGKEQMEVLLQTLDDEVILLKETIRNVEEENSHLLELHCAMAGHCRQAEEWTALYDTYASQLNLHIERIDAASAQSMYENENNGRNSLAAPLMKMMSMKPRFN